MTRPSLRLTPPDVHADQALGERLAELARASVPTTRPLRRRWTLPLAGAAIVVATGGVGWATTAVVHHVGAGPTIVAGATLSPEPTSSSADGASIAPSTAAPTRPDDGSAVGSATPGRTHRHHRHGHGATHGKSDLPHGRSDQSHGNGVGGGSSKVSQPASHPTHPAHPVQAQGGPPSTSGTDTAGNGKALGKGQGAG